MGINESEAVSALQVLERHCLDQSRLAGTRLPNDVYMQKAVFVLDAEDAIIIPKIDACKANSMTCIHIVDALSLRPCACTRLVALPKNRKRQQFRSETTRRRMEHILRNVLMALLEQPDATHRDAECGRCLTERMTHGEAGAHFVRRARIERSHFFSGNSLVKLAVPRFELPGPNAVTVIWYEWLPLGGLGGE